MVSIQDGTVTTELLLPLAVTLDTDGGGCVAGVTPDGRWLRPGPVTAADVSGVQPVFQFYQPMAVRMIAAGEPDARPEDRVIVGTPTCAGPLLRGEELATRLHSVLAPSAEAAFAATASAGLIEAEAHELYQRRSTGGRSFWRLRFTDRSGAGYDWIVRDVRLLAGSHPAAVLTGGDSGALLLAIGLTKPNGRFPGLFRGCHPLVVGVHSAVAVRQKGLG